MPDAIGTPFRLFDDDGRIAVSVDCAKCGYDLRGRTLEECCTECGAAIARSTRFAALRIGAPAAVRTIRSSARLLLVASLVCVVSAVTIPVFPLGLFVVPLAIQVATILHALVAWRLSCFRPVLAFFTICSFSLQAMVLLIFVGRLLQPYSGVELEVIILGSWLCLYVASQLLAMRAMAATLVMFEVDGANDINFSRLSLVPGVLILIIGVILLGVFVSSNSSVLYGVAVVLTMTVSLAYWVYAITICGECISLRSVLREPPPPAWFAARDAAN